MTRISVLGGILLSVFVTLTRGNDEEAVYFSSESTPLRRDAWIAGNSGSLVFSFKTVNPSGLLVYQGGVTDSGHSLSVGLQNGVLHLIFSGDSDHVKVPHDQGRKRTDDGQWHDVRVDVNEMAFSVDGVQTAVSFPSDGFQFDGVFWIGGVGQDVTVHPLLNEAFGIGYQGCFGGLHFSAEPISVMEIARNSPDAMVTVGCPTMTPSTEAPTSKAEESCGDSTEVRFEGGDSYLCLEPFTSIKKKGQISFHFKTVQAEAQLLFMKGKKNDVISVYLEGGAVVVRMDVGGGPTKLAIGSGLNDDMWHSVLVSKEDSGVLMLKVNEESTSGKLLPTSGGNTYFEVDGNLCFGGLDSGKGDQPSLVGCTRMIMTKKLIEEPKNEAETSKNVKAGCCSATTPLPMDPTTMKPSTSGPTTSGPITTEAVTTVMPRVTTEAVEVKTTTESATASGCSPDDEDCDDEDSTPTAGSKVNIITHTPTPTQKEDPSTQPCDDEDGCGKTEEPTEGSGTEMATMPVMTTTTEAVTEAVTEEGSGSEPTTEAVTPKGDTDTPTAPCDDEDNCEEGSGTEEPIFVSSTPTPKVEPQPTSTPTPKVEPEPTVTKYTADFEEGDNIKFTPNEPIKTDNLDLQLNFQTDQDEAALMFLEATKDSGVLVHITDGKVAMSVVDPAGSSKRRRRALSGTTFLSDEKINDGKAHEVGAKIDGGGVATTVDNKDPVKSVINVPLPAEVSNVQVGTAPGVPGFVGQMADVGVGDTNVMKEASDPTDPRFVSSVDISMVEVPVTQSPTEPPKPVTDDVVTDDSLTDGVDDKSAGGMSGGALAGAIIGAVLGVILVTALLVFVIIHYQRRDEGSYTLDEESTVKNGSPNNAKAAEAEGKEWYM